MTSSAQPERQVEVDLTKLESMPSEEPGGGIDAYTDFWLASKLFGIALRIRDKSSELTDGVRFLLTTVSVTIPTGAVAAVCAAARAPMAITVLASLGTMAVFTILSVMLVHGRRRNVALDQSKPAKPSLSRPAVDPENRVNHKNARRKRRPRGRR